MILAGGMVCLMDGLRGMHNLRLDGALVHHRYDILVHMVVDALAGNGGCSRGGLCGLGSLARRLELSELSFGGGFVVVRVFVADLAVFGRQRLVLVLLRQNLLVGYRLDGGVVVILMDFFVDGLSCLLVLMRLHCLVDDTRLDALINLGVVT